MRWLILCREPRLYSCQRLKQVCEQRGITLDILDPNRMLLTLSTTSGQNGFQIYHQSGETFDKNRPSAQLLPEYDAIIPRFGTSSTEMGCRVLQHFETKGVKVLNHSAAFKLARDKWQSLQILAEKGIPVPNSSLSGELVSASAALAPYSIALVIKTLTGSQGVGVMLSESPATSQSLLDTLKQANIETLQQHFIAEAKGQDIRAFVIGNQVIAAMQRTGKADEFRANLHQGGQANLIQLSDEEQQLAIKAAHAIGLAVAGVDLIRSTSGLYVLEVNASPGLEGIEKISKKDIAGLMVDYLLQGK